MISSTMEFAEAGRVVAAFIQEGLSHANDDVFMPMVLPPSTTSSGITEGSASVVDPTVSPAFVRAASVLIPDFALADPTEHFVFFMSANVHGHRAWAAFNSTLYESYTPLTFFRVQRKGGIDARMTVQHIPLYTRDLWAFTTDNAIPGAQCGIVYKAGEARSGDRASFTMSNIVSSFRHHISLGQDVYMPVSRRPQPGPALTSH